jgi:hypothetical protein
LAHFSSRHSREALCSAPLVTMIGIGIGIGMMLELAVRRSCR